MNNEALSAATGVIRLASEGDGDAIERQVDWIIERHGEDGARAMVAILARLCAAATEELADIRGKTVSEILTAFEDTAPNLDPDNGDEDD